MEFVDLICVKIKGKLRVRITTVGYLREANCQFARDIRLEGTRYKVKPQNIKLITIRGKWFYSIARSDVAEIINKDQQDEHIDGEKVKIKINHIYEDQDEPLCQICFGNKKHVVFNPCGHYCTCQECANKIFISTKNCPMCLKKITQCIDRDLIE